MRRTCKQTPLQSLLGVQHGLCHRGVIATSRFQPRLGLTGNPIHSVRVSLECADLLDGAIGPFGLYAPFIAVVQHYAEDWFTHDFSHSCIFPALRAGSKTTVPWKSTLPAYQFGMQHSAPE